MQLYILLKSDVDTYEHGVEKAWRNDHSQDILRLPHIGKDDSEH